MTETEWNESHPEQCSSYIKAWEQKYERERAREASEKLLHCQIHGVKINGRKPRMEDFMPSKRKNKGTAAFLKAQAQLAAARSKAIEDKKKLNNG